LKNSISFNPNSVARVGISEGQFVVLQQTQSVPDCLYHGYVSSWKELSDDMKAALRKKKFVNGNGKILKP
jgi:hypothetical protein